MKKTEEEMYREFVDMGYTHQEARELVFTAIEWREKITNISE